MPEVKANPDYQLVMNFLKLIQPGDMDEQSANQLMMIGQRIQNGGSLSDKEREMFQSVVGAMPEMQISYEVDGRMEAMTPSQMEAARASGEKMELDLQGLQALLAKQDLLLLCHHQCQLDKALHLDLKQQSLP